MCSYVFTLLAPLGCYLGKTTGMAVQHLPWLISVARIQASMFAATASMTGQNHTNMLSIKMEAHKSPIAMPAKALPGIDVHWGDTSIESMRQSFANE